MTTTSPTPESSQEETTNSQTSFNVGELLRTTRENKNLTLEEVYQEIRINIRILQTFEANNFQLDDYAPVYVKAYLKKYANLLGLDTERVVDEAFKSQNKSRKVSMAAAGSPHAQPGQGQGASQANKYKTATNYAREHARQNFIRRIIFAIIAVIVIGVATFFGVKFFSHKEQAPVVIQNNLNNSTDNSNSTTNSTQAAQPAQTNPSAPSTAPATSDNSASKPAAPQTTPESTPNSSSNPAPTTTPNPTTEQNTTPDSAKTTPSTAPSTTPSTSTPANNSSNNTTDAKPATTPSTSTPEPEAKKPTSRSDEDLLTSGQKISRMLADTKNQYIPTVGVNKITKSQIPLKGLYITTGRTYSRLALVNTKTGRTVHSGSFKPNVYIYTITPGTYRLSIYKNINSVSIYLNGVQQYVPARKNTIYITVK